MAMPAWLRDAWEGGRMDAAAGRLLIHAPAAAPWTGLADVERTVHVVSPEGAGLVAEARAEVLDAMMYGAS